MASNPEAQGASPSAAGRTDFGQATANTMSMKWSALLDAGDIVCTLAGLAPETRKAAVRNFPAVMKDTGGWRCALAERGVDDLTAIMEPGIAALLAARARGTDPAAAALALWHEFDAARASLLGLVPPVGARRSA